MSYKKRPLKTDADSVAAFWNKLEVDQPSILKYFHYWFKTFPSDNMTESFHHLILEFHRLETLKRFDPKRIKSTSIRNRTVQGQYQIYLFNQVKKVLSYAYNERRIHRKREIRDEELFSLGSQGLKNKAEVHLFNPPKPSKKSGAVQVQKEKKIRVDEAILNSPVVNADFIDIMEINKILNILKEHLSDKQYRLFELILDGKTQSEIADEWGISCTMVGVHLKKIKQRIHTIRGMPDLLAKYLREKVQA